MVKDAPTLLEEMSELHVECAAIDVGEEPPGGCSQKARDGLHLAVAHGAKDVQRSPEGSLGLKRLQRLGFRV